MQRVDVAIVGAGPAGTSAARAAAEAGASAMVVEKGVPRADRERLGPDSTDAAGFLDYWVDVADLDVNELPDDVVLRILDGAKMYGPSDGVTLERTGMDASYDHFGFTFHRARMDDFLRDRAEAAGAEFRIGTSVKSVETDLVGDPEHTLLLADGDEIVADHLILADGPQRRVTIPVLDRYLPEGRTASEALNPRTANHIAYQEYRRFPEDAFDPGYIAFWWGWIPGTTAYPWVFPNEDSIARVGLTMPIGMDIDAVANRADYRLLRPEDDRIPAGGTYVDRLLEELYGDRYDVESDFPVVEDGHGKRHGTETYPISSTTPVDSPTAANIAVVGGAMGTTSAFHEGGDHVAMRTGKIAGRLAATGALDRYNREWKAAIGEEVRRNVAMAHLVADYGPRDWDRAISVAKRMLAARDEGSLISLSNATASVGGLSLYLRYRWRRYGLRGERCAQIRESEYRVQ